MDFQGFIDGFWSLTITGVALGSVYALVALGYTLVYGVLKLINFANSEVFMLGTFGSFIVLWALGVPRVTEDNADPLKTGFTLVGMMLLSLVLSMLISAVAAVLLERLAYRPLRKRGAPRLVFLITAIGASFMMAEAVGLLGPNGRLEYSLPRILERRTVATFPGGAVLQINQVIIVVGAVVMAVSLLLFVNRTRLGRGIRAVAQDAETARLMGVNVDRVIMLTFLLGGLMAGAAAFFYQVQYGTTRFSVGFLLGVKAFTAAVLGGIGNIQGALLGGLLLGLLENYGGTILKSQQMGQVVAFSILVLVLMFRPSGILGETLGRARV